MKKFALAFSAIAFFALLTTGCNTPMTPKQLYKILSIENWDKSQKLDTIALAEMDNDFIHFATEQQLAGIIDKFWKNVSKFMVLTIDTQKLSGQLKFETNPGGTTKYYHLYDGKIPRDAIISAEKKER